MDAQTTAVPELLTVPETVAKSRLSKRNIENQIASGELPVIRIGNRVLIDGDDLAVFLRSHRTRGKANTMPVPTPEDNNIIAGEIRQALRHQMGGDPVAALLVFRNSRYPLHMHLAGTVNALARVASETPDPEQFLDVITEIIARD
jgi:hypothetical protein